MQYCAKDPSCTSPETLFLKNTRIDRRGCLLVSYSTLAYAAAQPLTQRGADTARL